MRFGLIGKNLNHSFSKDFFKNKFEILKLKNYQYQNFEINNVKEIINIINKNNLKGLNITIPFKSDTLTIVDDIDEHAKNIGSINTLRISNSKIKGYNTDYIGFQNSIQHLIGKRKEALILGSGGSSKAIQYALKNLNVNYKIVSRSGNLNYQNLTKEDIITNMIIINTTPLGMYPNINQFPKIPYHVLSKEHLVYDLIYNPEETIFLKKSKEMKCIVKNGFEMLKIQAEESWKIWNN